MSEAEPGWRDALDARGLPVVVDLGAGDGRFVYQRAKRDPGSLYIAVDPDAASLAQYAFRAGRKPSRGGIANAVFVVAAVEALPDELRAIANKVHAVFPWGSLLRGLLRPEEDVLRGFASLGGEGARFEIVTTYGPAHDLGAFEGEALPPLDEAYIDAVLIEPYARAGLQIESRQRLTQDEALAIPSTWGRRLLHGRRRHVYEIKGSIRRGAQTR